MCLVGEGGNRNHFPFRAWCPVYSAYLVSRSSSSSRSATTFAEELGAVGMGMGHSRGSHSHFVCDPYYARPILRPVSFGLISDDKNNEKYTHTSITILPLIIYIYHTSSAHSTLDTFGKHIHHTMMDRKNKHSLLCKCTNHG